MRIHALGALALALAFSPPSAGGQDEPVFPFGKGTIEVGIFGQYTRFDAEAGCPCVRPDNSFGGGARVGYFVTRALELEADAVFSKPDIAVAGGKMDHEAFALRLNYNILPGSMFSALAGVGPVLTRYHDGHGSEWGGSVIIGARAHLSRNLAVRIDGLADYMPSTENLNLAGRLGVSLLVGGRRETQAAPVLLPVPRPAEPIAPPPARRPEPAPAPAPIVTIDTTAITGPIYFDFDRADIRADAAATLERKLPWLRANPGMRIRIEAHADERGSDEYNIALTQRRAASTKSWLVARGIAADRLDGVGYGEERPICSTRDEACWQSKRRADFVIRTIGSSAITVPRED